MQRLSERSRAKWSEAVGILRGDDIVCSAWKHAAVSRDGVSLTNSLEHKVMYGAGAKKLARILGRSENQGASIKKDFYKAHPAIKELNDALVNTYRSRGSLRGIDGRPLYCRGENKLLNQLLQNGAAVVFKRWMVVCDDNKEQYLSIPLVTSVEQMIAYHDELQFEVRAPEPEARLWGQTVCQAALQVGEEMKILVPIEAEYKCGGNWSQCH